MSNQKHDFWIFSITTWTVILVVGEMMLYTPSLPLMIDYFATTADKMQQLVSVSFFGLFFGIISGALSDYFGRKLLYSLGIVLFTIGSFGCCVVETLDAFLLCKLLQGVGSGMPSALIGAIYSDYYSEKKALKRLGMLNGLLAISLIFIPIIGNKISVSYDWRINFYLIFGLALLTTIITLLKLPDTHFPEKEKPFTTSYFFSLYKVPLTSRCFLYSIATFGCIHACMMVYVSNMSLVFVNYLGVSEEHAGLYQAIFLIPYACTGYFSSQIYDYFGRDTVIQTMMKAGAVAILLFFLTAYTGHGAPIIYTLLMMGVAALGGFAIPYFYLRALTPFHKERGSAGALGSALRHIIIAVSVEITARHFDGSMRPIAATLMVLLVVSLLGNHLSLRAMSKLKAT